MPAVRGQVTKVGLSAWARGLLTLAWAAFGGRFLGILAGA